MREDFNTIRRLRYPLPEVVEPVESICIQVQIPNDLAYIAAFWGQMFALTRWYAWMSDEAHTGKDVAARWLQVYEAAKESECQNVLVRTSPDNDCLLQVSYDGGGLWETVYNAYSCALKAANDEFGSHSVQPGGRSQPGEQPGGATPEPGQCFDLDLTVQATGMCLIPLAISDGWTIQLTEVKGAWTDGGFLSMWACPDAHQFSMGACGATVMGTESTDPMPAVPHMKLIGRLPSGTFVELPLDGSTYTVPNAQPAGNMFLLANDGGLSDNQGSVSLHLLACSPAAIVVHCTYLLQATGPAEIHIGDTFDIEVNTPVGGNWNGGVRFDRCCTLTYIATIDGPVTQADSEDCAHVSHPGFDTTDVTKMGFNSSVQRFTLRLRLDSVV